MNEYLNYQDFLHDLTVWGKRACQGTEDFCPCDSFLDMLTKASQSADRGVFSPFLYLSLSARLEWEEMMLLAATLYAGLCSESLDFLSWQRFWDKKERQFPGTELYFQSSPLLYVQEWEENVLDARLRINPRLFLFLIGILPKENESPLVAWYHRTEDPLPPLGTSARQYHKIQQCLSAVPGKKLIYLKGQKGSGRKLNYAYLAAESGMSLAVVSWEDLQEESQLLEIRIECLLNHAMLALELGEKEENLDPLLSWLGDEESIFLLGTRKEIPLNSSFSRQYLPFSISTQKVLKDKELFETLSQAYRWEQEEDRKNFLNRFNFLPGRMRNILDLAASYALSQGNGRILDCHLRRAILGVSSHSLDQYAKKIRGVYQMQDLILPELQKQKLFHIINRIRNQKLVYEEWGFYEKSAYGNGVSMVFAGPPGTGKTMAAQVIASELGMELYRVELPAVVDKYIGETEKKLNRIFSEAEKSMAILFFDEADVLFSKRTEIKESNDKYNNMEIAFLLQKMEEYEGISILATNYLQNFDSAFRRRISDMINFPLPDARLRKQMWQSMIPSKLPVSDEIDFHFLSEQFEISGSVIKHSLIYASFLAAEMQEPLISMELILKGLSHELEKSGKKLSRDEYGEYGHLF